MVTFRNQDVMTEQSRAERRHLVLLEKRVPQPPEELHLLLDRPQLLNSSSRRTSLTVCLAAADLLTSPSWWKRSLVLFHFLVVC